MSGWTTCAREARQKNVRWEWLSGNLGQRKCEKAFGLCEGKWTKIAYKTGSGSVYLKMDALNNIFPVVIPTKDTKRLTSLSNYIRNFALANIWGFQSFHHTCRFADGFRTWIGADFCCCCCCCTKWRRPHAPCHQYKTCTVTCLLPIRNVFNYKSVRLWGIYTTKLF